MTEIVFDGLRTWQRKAFAGLKRFNVLVCHRRSGKTVLSLIWLLSRVAPLANGRGAYIAPLYNQAKRVAWDYLQKYARVIPGAAFNQAELSVSFSNGARIYLLGADNFQSLRGIGLDAVVMDEVAQMGPSVWTQVIRPALSDRQGSALFIGTPFGRANQFYDFWKDAENLPDWSRYFLPVTDSGCIDPQEVEALKREMSEADFAQEYLCSFDAAVRGAFFGKEMANAEAAGRVGRIPHDPALPVLSAWDLGFSDLTVIWCLQVAASEVRAIECLAFQSTALPDIVRELRTRPYNWTDHYLPHDAKVRELGTGRSRVEVLADLGLRATVVPAQPLADGIESTRTLIPRMWFDREGCRVGVEALKTYRTEWDDQKRVFNRTPLHSWESHYADALRTFAVSNQGRKPQHEPLVYRDRVVA